MDAELIKSEFIRRYPIGTKFRSLQGMEDVVDNHDKLEYNSGHHCIYISSLHDTSREVYNTRNGGEWAEILELPKPEINNNYPIF